MDHGIDAYRIERRRFERRLSFTMLGVAAFMLGAEQGLIVAERVPWAARALHTISPVHWGYEGPEQYVRRIELESQGGVSQNPGLRAEYIPASHKGGSRTRPSPPSLHAAPQTRPLSDALGDADVERAARARARARNMPMVRSEELVIERLVRPIYPEEARSQDIEGRVVVMALVDTTGEVTQVELVGSNEGILERAAEDAVWKCRFKPYVLNGRKAQVYAMFRFAFRIY